jgi:hypothetical protein
MIVDRLSIVDREPKVPVLCVGLLRIIPFQVTLAGASALIVVYKRAHSLFANSLNQLPPSMGHPLARTFAHRR